MKILVLILAILVPALSYAKPFFPSHDSCAGKEKSQACKVVLNEDGFLVDAVTGEKLSEISEDTGMMSANWLYIYGDKYVLEHLDFSSSKSRSWVVFSYSKQQVVVDRIYSFSQVISAASVAAWYGYECRAGEGSLINAKDQAFSESAVSAFCGKAARNSLKLRKETPDSSMGVDIAINIPVYSAGETADSATYLFFDTDKPDFFQMACYSNCKLKSDGTAITYVGRVSKSTWFLGDIKNTSCASEGSYKYKSSSEKIVFDGCVEAGSMKLTEYAAGGKSPRAQFVGKADGDGYKGEWISKSGDNKKYSFFMFPLTVY
ncbi:hypothetical protein LOY28_29055 [Pseudomonas sp. B21-017]|uniref:hypothetical protein n=1 Tax=Pseudomonas sp. B21-017 TaxID=2895474 RepID=UPI002160C581|nr:hypothetical protein [Pseudomonas sp. B21-017]UVM38701.1 hypothetical protein LOY28_29055 [Pseudomonas sp. B21-017]